MADVDRAKWNMSRTVWLNGFVDLSCLAFGLSLLICELFRATHIRQVCDSSPKLRFTRQMVFEWVATRRRTRRSFPARPTQICSILSAAWIFTLFRFAPNALGDDAWKSAAQTPRSVQRSFMSHIDTSRTRRQRDPAAAYGTDSEPDRQSGRCCGLRPSGLERLIEKLMRRRTRDKRRPTCSS